MIIRWTLAVLALCLGLLVLVSCEETRPISSLLSSKELKQDLKEASHFGFAQPRVTLSVRSQDTKLQDELNNCLIAAFTSVKGVTLTASDPLYKIEVLASEVENDIAASVAIVEMTASCRGCLVTHHLLAGSKDRMKQLCQKIAAVFETRHVAPYR